MSVLLETSLGEIVIDLNVNCKKSALNFLKLCKVKHYNYSWMKITKNFTAQVNTEHVSSVWGYPILIKDLLTPKCSAVGFATSTVDGKMVASSSFYITLGDVESMDGKHGLFGVVAEGMDVLEKINNVFVDDSNRPFIDVRILHTIILDDPYPDPKGLVVPDASPLPTRAQLADARLPDEGPEISPEDQEAQSQRDESAARALTLEMVGDLPFAEIKPPENILFVCKLNPVTRDQDLELIFSRFGTILSCEIIRDPKTQDSLGYAFIEFENQTDCEEAYAKMENVLIDDKRIHVDFSQSVAKLGGPTKKFEYGDGLEKKSRYRFGKKEREYKLLFEHEEQRQDKKRRI